VCFVVAFAAGTTVGMLVERSSHPPRPGSYISDRLKLDEQQRQQMRVIWSEVMEGGEGRFGNRRALMEERDKALRDLLTDEQKARHDEILAEYERKRAELAAEREARRKEAEKQTLEILTEEQRKKFQEMLNRGFRGDGRPWGGRPGQAPGAPREHGGPPGRMRPPGGRQDVPREGMRTE
jgi:Spy/CpxP family protein refolding chaperone